MSLLLLAGGVALVQPVDAAETTGTLPEDCERPDPDLRIGTACRDGDMWEVYLDDGSTVRTHGPDPAPATPEQDGVEAVNSHAPQKPPVCVSDPNTEHHQRILYVHSSDQPDRSASLANDIRGIVREANGWLSEEALEFGYDARYLVQCDDAGRIDVTSVRIPTKSTKITFQRLVSDVKDQGYSSQLSKYQIWYDDSADVVDWGGMGTWVDDSSKLPTNANNQGPSYAVVWGYFSAHTWMHENGHNLGATQPGAPDFFLNYGGHHCYDGHDVMCYGNPDGDKYKETYCPDREHYDCDHDTYFHPNPPRGSYLDENWNIGDPMNRWITYVRCDLTTLAGNGLEACQQAVLQDGDGAVTFAGAGTGDAEGELAAVSTDGDAECWGRACVAASLGDGESQRGSVSHSHEGSSRGTVGTSTHGDAHGVDAAASGTGDASGTVALSGSGDAEGAVPVSLLGTCFDRRCLAVDEGGSADGSWLAAAGDGDARCETPYACAAVAVGGDASCPIACAAVAVDGSADSANGAAVATEDATAPFAAASLYGDADALVAGSGTGNASGTAAGSGTGTADGLWVALSGTGPANGFLAVSVLGDAEGPTAVDGCDDAPAGDCPAGPVAALLP